MDFGQPVRMGQELPKDRLRQAMEAATGLTKPTDAWEQNKKALRVGKDLFISNLNGNRDISKASAAKYAAVFKVTPGWILYGDSEGEAAPAELSQLEAVSALAAALSDAEAMALHRRLSDRIEAAARSKSSAGRARKTATKATSGQRTHSS